MDSTTIKTADGGLASRKLWYAIGTALAVVLVGCLGAWWPSFRAELETVVGGVCGTFAIYCGANVTSKWALGKTLNVAQATDAPDPRPPVEPLPE